MAQLEAEQQTHDFQTLSDVQVQKLLEEATAAAVHALTSFIKNGGFAFLTHLDECWERLSYLWEYPHSLLKIAVSACFHAFFCLIVNHQLSAHNEITPDPEGNKHFPRDGRIAYNENVQRLITTIFPLYIQALRDEDDRDALSVMMDYFIA